MYWPGWFIFLSPLIGAPIALAVGKRYKSLAGIIASLAVGGALIASIITFFYVDAGTVVSNSSKLYVITGQSAKAYGQERDGYGFNVNGN